MYDRAQKVTFIAAAPEHLHRVHRCAGWRYTPTASAVGTLWRRCGYIVQLCAMKACTADVHDKPQAYSQPYTKQLVLNAWHRKTATYSVAYSTCAAHGAAGASCFDRQKISCIMTCERRLQRLVLTGQVHRWALPSKILLRTRTRVRTPCERKCDARACSSCCSVHGALLAMARAASVACHDVAGFA